MRAISLLFHDVYASNPAESGFRSDAADRYKLSVSAFEAQLDGVARVRSDAPVVVGGGSLSGGSRARGNHREPWDPPHTVDNRGHDSGSLSGGSRAYSNHAAPWDPPHTAEHSSVWGGCRSGSAEGAPGADPPYAAAPPYVITFDDGGVSYHTFVADRLEARGWRGHCFVSTDYIGTSGFLNAAQIRELDARGHVIGSHSASHPPRFSAQPFDEMVSEWARSRQVLEDMVGHAVEVASVPGGYVSPAVAHAAREAGIRILFTSEPETHIASGSDCTLIGRFTLRHGHAADTAQRLVAPAPWARATAWASWNAKGVVKPLLGASYIRLAHRLHALRRPVTS